MRWPAPAPDAPITTRIVLRLLLPIGVGAGIALGLDALMGLWSLAILLPAAMIYCVRELRWIKRMKAEILADQARLEELRRGP